MVTQSFCDTQHPVTNHNIPEAFHIIFQGGVKCAHGAIVLNPTSYDGCVELASLQLGHWVVGSSFTDSHHKSSKEIVKSYLLQVRVIELFTLLLNTKIVTSTQGSVETWYIFVLICFSPTFPACFFPGRPGRADIPRWTSTPRDTRPNLLNKTFPSQKAHPSSRCARSRMTSWSSHRMSGHSS